MALVQRFIAANQREAMRQVREKLGDDAVILSTRPDAQECSYSLLLRQI